MIYSDISDKELIRIIVDDKNSRAYEAIYQRYFNKVQDRCYSFLHNKTLASDFANEIMGKVYEKLPSFKGNSSFSSWLYAITYNYLIDYLRKKKHSHYPSWNENNEIPEIIDESDAEMEELSYEKLTAILEKIHPEEKALLLMKYQDDLSLKTISVALAISEDAVKMRLKRARSRVIYLYHHNNC